MRDLLRMNRRRTQRYSLALRRGMRGESNPVALSGRAEAATARSHGIRMIKFSILSVLLLALLAGCGEVVVFGHVVREAPAKSAPAAPDASPATESAPATAKSSASLAAVSPPGAHIVQALNLTVSPEAKAG